jgi:hypothetical protein
VGSVVLAELLFLEQMVAPFSPLSLAALLAKVDI